MKILSQNVCKNNLLINTLLETCKDYNILFIQKPQWSLIQCISSSSSEEGKEIIGFPNYLSWTMFTQSFNINNKHLRVLIYINVCLSRLCFSLKKNMINHRDINLISFFNNSFICFLFNVYLYDQQSISKYIKDTEVNLNNVLIMTGDFNIRNNEQDPLYPYHPNYTDSLKEIADSFNIKLSTPVNQVSMQYADNPQDSNFVLDLMFLLSTSEELNNQIILPYL